MLPIVILRDRWFNHTWSSLRFRPWGDFTQLTCHVCDTWRSGFEWAQRQGYRQVLFVKSGTVFLDIDRFFEEVSHYPHQGMVAHIIDPRDPAQYFSIHPQCFLLDVTLFQSEDFESGDFEGPTIKRSDKNIHHDYTPLWCAPADPEPQTRSTTQGRFGQRLVARHLSHGRVVCNWYQHLRSNKLYLYTEQHLEQWQLSQQDYRRKAQNQLWVFNNADFEVTDCQHLISPASGLYWMINAVSNPRLRKITLCDISHQQIKLAQYLYQHWDGTNYGQAVWNFVKRHKITEPRFDQPLDSIERLKLRKQQHFVDYANNVFAQQLAQHNITVDNFAQHWPTRPQQVEFINDNIVHQVNNNKISMDSDTTVWVSNILDYKYTWLDCTVDEIEQFKQCLEKKSHTA